MEFECKFGNFFSYCLTVPQNLDLLNKIFYTGGMARFVRVQNYHALLPQILKGRPDLAPNPCNFNDRVRGLIYLRYIS